MQFSTFTDYLHDVFEDSSLFGFSSIDKNLAENSKCQCALVTVLPYPELDYKYNAVEFFDMLEGLRKLHSGKLTKIKTFLDDNGVRYALPPAAPKDNGNHLADFSYKWAAIHAGLGFIGKNDVFVHYSFAQRVRISCLLIDICTPCFSGEINSKCGECDLCVRACPYGFITGSPWSMDIRREELIDYKNCAAKSKHDGDGQNYLCARCSLSCTYSTCVE